MITNRRRNDSHRKRSTTNLNAQSHQSIPNSIKGSFFNRGSFGLSTSNRLTNTSRDNSQNINIMNSNSKNNILLNSNDWGKFKFETLKKHFPKNLKEKPSLKADLHVVISNSKHQRNKSSKSRHSKSKTDHDSLDKAHRRKRTGPSNDLINQHSMALMNFIKKEPNKNKNPGHTAINSIQKNGKKTGGFGILAKPNLSLSKKLSK